ncbi:hypothetical protein COOONC_15237 [Cooperia oncophora]
MRLAVVLATIYTAIAMPSRRNESSSESMEDYEDGETWECGTDAFSKYISENQIELDCPHSCKARKSYKFVICGTIVVTKGSKVCNQENSPLFCGMVREFGLEAYLRSGNNTSSNATLIEEPQEPTKLATANRSKHDSNDYDYESAVSVNDTVAENSHLKGVDLLDGILKSHQ